MKKFWTFIFSALLGVGFVFCFLNWNHIVYIYNDINDYIERVGDKVNDGAESNFENENSVFYDGY